MSNRVVWNHVFYYIVLFDLVWHRSQCAMIESKVVSIAQVLVAASVSHAHSLVGTRDCKVALLG